MSDADKAPSSGGKAPESQSPRSSDEQPSGARVSVEVDERNAAVCYANFCRVTGTPEELLLDFGLNSQPYGAPTEPIEVSQRLVVNYYTAKRMLQALHLSVQRHEQAFGALQTDVQKRVIAQPQRSGNAS